MNYFLRFFCLIPIFAFIFSGCSSTKSTAEKETNENVSWQKKVKNKFSFHTGREHKARREAQEKYEREQYLAEQESAKTK